MSMPGKTFLLISRASPYGSTQAREALDIAFAAAAFNQRIQVLFMDDGVLQLAPGQQPSATSGKTLAKTLGMLEHYDVTDIYVEQSSLAARGLTPDELVLDCKVLDNASMGRLVAGADTVFGG